MAAIDYKQKIKDYMNSSEVDTLYKSMLSNLFPELAESEDKRIRKAIINIIGDIDGGFKFEKYGILKKDALVWLEKKDENGAKGNEREIPNSTWSEEDEENMIMIEDRLSDYLDYIREDTSLTKLNKNSMKEEIIEYVNWLKSLKDRVLPQLKQVWSEEDEGMLQTVINRLELSKNRNASEMPYVERCVEWLKSLRPQSAWKPSDEQMKALDFYIKTYVDTEGCYGSEVLELYEQLKKLREE